MENPKNQGASNFHSQNTKSPQWKRRKKWAAVEKRKLGFEPTIVGYIYSLHTYRKFRRKVGSSDEFKKILPGAFLRRKHGTSDGGVGTSDAPSEVPMKDF